MSARRSRAAASRSNQAASRQLRLEPLEDRYLLAADFDLVGEFFGDIQGRGSSPDLIGEFQGKAILATLGSSSPKLWSSDGTEAGTTKLVDFAGSGILTDVTSHTVMDGTLYLLATRIDIGPNTGDDLDLVESWELWKSDGTTTGTTLVRTEQMYDYAYGSAKYLTAVDGQLFFMVQEFLWSSDGTSSGTSPVDYAANNWQGELRALIYVGDTLFLVSGNGFGSTEGLWKFDVETRAASELKDPNTNQSLRPSNIARVGDSIFFTAYTPDTGRELWKSDGTQAGTSMIKDINPGPLDSSTGLFREANGVVFFSANDGTSGSELWRSDGTEAGTFRVKDINAGPGPSYMGSKVDVSGVVFFLANDGHTGHELWKSDGTEAGTVRVADIRPGIEGPTPGQLTNVNGILYFVANDGTSDREVWRSDGTEEGTYMVRDILAAPGGSSPSGLMNIGGRLFFTASGRLGDQELWISDGTYDGTRQVIDLNDRELTVWRKPLFEFNGGLFFSAQRDSHYSVNDELWKTDGTADGTTLFKEFNPGGFGSLPKDFTVFQESLYFSVFVGDYSAHGLKSYHLWRTDGTTAGSSPVVSNLAALSAVTRVRESLYFVGGTTAAPGVLWKSDGTPAGTAPLKAIQGGDYSSNLRYLTNVAGRLFFTANDGTTGEELWTSDGTELGTKLVKDIVPGLVGAAIQNLTEAGGVLYFTANDGVNGVELWRSDGSAQGTYLVKDIAAGSTGSAPAQLLNVGGTLYFVANDGVAGAELWRSDGTAAGTTLVRDILPGAAGSSPTQLVNVGGTLFFAADDGDAGSELWKSDGAEAGATLVAELRPGAASSNPVNLTNIDGRLYFHANDGTAGVELWASDGTAAGTELIAEFDAEIGIGLASLEGRVVVITLNNDFHEQVWVAAAPSPGLPGDYDGNGRVDGGDFLAWQRGFGGSATPAGSGVDGDASGTVDAGDLAIWKEQFGAGGSTTVATAASVVASDAIALPTTPTNRGEFVAVEINRGDEESANIAAASSRTAEAPSVLSATAMFASPREFIALAQASSDHGETVSPRVKTEAIIATFGDDVAKRPRPGVTADERDAAFLAWGDAAGGWRPQQSRGVRAPRTAGEAAGRFAGEVNELAGEFAAARAFSRVD